MEVIGLHDNRRQDDPCALKHRDISPGGITIHFDSIRRILVLIFLLLTLKAADTALAFQLPPAPFNAIPVGDSPFALALSPDNRQAVVVNCFLREIRTARRRRPVQATRSGEIVSNGCGNS